MIVVVDKEMLVQGIVFVPFHLYIVDLSYEWVRLSQLLQVVIKCETNNNNNDKWYKWK